MLVTQKIGIAMAVWTALILAVVGNGSLSLFVVLILIGLLMVRELSSVYIRPSAADRLDVFIQVGLVMFIAIVARRILSILGVF